jgi:hypothetical protein
VSSRKKRSGAPKRAAKVGTPAQDAAARRASLAKRSPVPPDPGASNGTGSGAPTRRPRHRALAEEPRADVARERRIGIPAGLAALGSLGCSIASVPVAASGTSGGRIAAGTSERRLLLDVHSAGSGQTAAMLLRVAGLLLLIVVALYCYDITKSRRPETPKWVPLVGIASFILLALNTFLGFNAVKDLADTFVGSGAQTPERAKQLLDDSALLRGVPANLGRYAINAMFGLWLGMVCMDMMRVGLLTRFLGYFGFAGAVTFAVGFPAGDALTFGWLGSLGILALGYWPGGRPLAWAEGRAVPLEEEQQAARPRKGSAL